MLIPEFQGGLGNMMFQMASTYAIAKKTGHSFGIIDIPPPPAKHSTMTYKDTIFRGWEFYKTNLLPSQKVAEHNGHPISLASIPSIPNTAGVILQGYFQREEYLRGVESDLPALFHLPWTPSHAKHYTDIDHAYFLHVRRGDYVGNTFHELDFTEYYKRAIDRIRGAHPNAIAYVVSNDMAWCKQWPALQSIPHRFIDENEVDTLTIMIRCALGGIAVNSSFSWWGLYLNRNRPHLLLPDRWYPHDIIRGDGYMFQGATQLSLASHCT